MMYLEKALCHLHFPQAAMLMIDKTFKGSKLICLLLAGLIGHTYMHPTKCSVCFSTLVSLGLWATSQDIWLNDRSSLVVPPNTIHRWQTIPSHGTMACIQAKNGHETASRGETNFAVQIKERWKSCVLCLHDDISPWTNKRRLTERGKHRSPWLQS